MFYEERKSSAGAFMAGLGLGVAAAAVGVIAYKKFKETHPDFNLKEYCEKCGILSDECDMNCDEDCESCSSYEPQYEEDCDIEDIEVDMTTCEDEEEEASDEEDGGSSLIGNITADEALSKATKIAKSIYGNDVVLQSEGSKQNILIDNNGKTKHCYMFWIESNTDDVTPVAVLYVDAVTGEVYDNSEKEMKKISD